MSFDEGPRRARSPDVINLVTDDEDDDGNEERKEECVPPNRSCGRGNKRRRTVPPLFEAIRNGDIDTITELLAAHPDLIYSRYHRTASDTDGVSVVDFLHRPGVQRPGDYWRVVQALAPYIDDDVTPDIGAIHGVSDNPTVYVDSVVRRAGVSAKVLRHVNKFVWTTPFLSDEWTEARDMVVHHRCAFIPDDGVPHNYFHNAYTPAAVHHAWAQALIDSSNHPSKTDVDRRNTVTGIVEACAMNFMHSQYCTDLVNGAFGLIQTDDEKADIHRRIARAIIVPGLTSAQSDRWRFRVPTVGWDQAILRLVFQRLDRAIVIQVLRSMVDPVRRNVWENWFYTDRDRVEAMLPAFDQVVRECNDDRRVIAAVTDMLGMPLPNLRYNYN